jgi:hypothetical protein
MGHVLVWHLDGRLPNRAPMRLAAHPARSGLSSAPESSILYGMRVDGPKEALRVGWRARLVSMAGSVHHVLLVGYD